MELLRLASWRDKFRSCIIGGRALENRVKLETIYEDYREFPLVLEHLYDLCCELKMNLPAAKRTGYLKEHNKVKGDSAKKSNL